MKKDFLKNCIIIILIIIILIFSFMLPRELSEYKNKEYLSRINEISYDTSSKNVEELEYNEKLRIVSELLKKGNMYYSNDKNLQITTNDSILQKNEMSLDQIVKYVISEIKEFLKANNDINYSFDYTKSAVESKYIKIIDKTNSSRQMSAWDLTFKASDSNYVNFLVDSVSGKIYGIIIYNDKVNFKDLDYNYENKRIEYAKYLNITSLTQETTRKILESSAYYKKSVLNDYITNIEKSMISLSIRYNSISYSLFSIY